MFELKLNNKAVQLKWGTWAMREFCTLKGVGFDQYFEILAKSQTDLDVIIKLVHAGYKSACIANKEEEVFTESDVCDWIDEVGSIFNNEGQLLEYIKYIVSTTTNNAQIKASVEKKKPNKANVGRHIS